jgi:hypothetical protein
MSLQRAQAAASEGRYHEAIGICRDVLAKRPENALAMAIMGTAKAQLGELGAGAALLNEAIRRNSGVAEWHFNLSAICYRAFWLEEALQAGIEAYRLDPGNADHLVNLSFIYLDLDDRERAKACLVRAIGISPDHGDAHLALGQILLAEGEFLPGWAEYEWRNRVARSLNTLPQLTSMQWNGMKMPTGRLLLVADQGFGDCIQFSRFIPLIADRVQEIVLACPRELAPVLAKVPGVAATCSKWDETPAHAAWFRLSSLPHLLGTTVDAIPSASQPYIFADPERVASWSGRLGPRSGVRVGLAWSGRAAHPNDARRRVPVAELEPLWRLPDVQFIPIQKPIPDADKQIVGDLPDFSADLHDFQDTAALVANMDVIVTIDTSLAHLAGAMGIQTLLMLGKTPDWRWLIGRDYSVWYPNVRLFRQEMSGDWAPVVERVAEVLGGYT